MLLIRIDLDGFAGAVLGAERAADAIVGDAVRDERLALARGAAAVEVRLVLIAEMFERRQHGVRRGRAQPAHAALRDHVAELFEPFEVARSRLARAEAFEDVEHPLRSHAARRALPARLLLRKL